MCRYGLNGIEEWLGKLLADIMSFRSCVSVNFSRLCTSPLCLCSLWTQKNCLSHFCDVLINLWHAKLIGCCNSCRNIVAKCLPSNWHCLITTTIKLILHVTLPSTEKDKFQQKRQVRRGIKNSVCYIEC